MAFTLHESKADLLHKQKVALKTFKRVQELASIALAVNIAVVAIKKPPRVLALAMPAVYRSRAFPPFQSLVPTPR